MEVKTNEYVLKMIEKIVFILQIQPPPPLK